MTLSSLKSEIKDLKKDYIKVYDQIMSFSEFLLEKGLTILDVNFSFVSASTYVDFDLNNGFDDYTTIRFSNHEPRGNYGTTDLNYGFHLTNEENYNWLIEIMEDKGIELLKRAT